MSPLDLSLIMCKLLCAPVDDEGDGMYVFVRMFQDLRDSTFACKSLSTVPTVLWLHEDPHVRTRVRTTGQADPGGGVR